VKYLVKVVVCISPGYFPSVTLLDLLKTIFVHFITTWY